MKEKELLAVKNISKRFAGVQALSDVSFDVQAGEVHALIGENGAGKSTLMKILSGVHSYDSGSMSFLGEKYQPQGPGHALNLGVAIVHQELLVMEHLSVAQTVFIGRESSSRSGLFLDEKQQNRRTEEIFAQLGVDIDVTTRMGELAVAKQQMVEIVRAISFDLKVLILDEPTASLTTSETHELFKMIAVLKEKNVGIIYISHKLQEIHTIAQRLTVLRDGQFIGTLAKEQFDAQKIIQMMVGRVVYTLPKSESEIKDDAEVVLEVKNICAPPLVHDVSFKLRRGEILGLAGLIGAGRTETLRAVFGADELQSGEIYLEGQAQVINSPTDAIALGIGYISEDRKRYSLALNRSVSDNIMLSSWEEYSKFGLLRWRRIQEICAEYVRKLRVKTPSITQILNNLSGGNQQKVIIARWLLRNCKVLIFDEPTRGIDVGARSEIYNLMKHFVEKEGKSIVLISSDLTEILHLSDRVVVLRDGFVTATLKAGKMLTQDSIMHYATQAHNVKTFA